jgi:hypothetical protein
MQQLVFPDPIAPRIATPVNKPLSGITSHWGLSAGFLRGLWTSPTTRKRSSLFGVGKRAIGRPDSVLRLERKMYKPESTTE